MARFYLVRIAAAWIALLPSRLPMLFVLATAPVLVFFALTTPAGEVPDEVAHIVRADSVRLGQVAGSRTIRLDAERGPVQVVVVRGDQGLFEAGFALSGNNLAAKQVTRARMDVLLSKRWQKPLATIEISNTGVYPPILYAPAALGLQITKWSGLGPSAAIIGARLANVLAYLLLGSAALRLALRGRTILFALLCLPMSLFLAGSVSQDGVAIACGALAGALLTRPTRRAWWTGVAALSVVVMAKPYLLPLALIVPAAMPIMGRRDAARALVGLAAAAMPAIIWGAAMALFVAAPFQHGAEPAGPLWTGAPGYVVSATDPGAQLHILLAVPSRLLTLPLEEAWVHGTGHWHEFIGALGQLDIPLSNNLYRTWGWILLASLLAGFVGTRRARPAVPALPALAAWASVVMSLWLVFILQYLSWTHVGAAVIDGVQGRYFIPVAAIGLPVLTLPIVRLPTGSIVRVALSLPVIAMAFGGIGLLPLLTLWAYYVR